MMASWGIGPEPILILAHPNFGASIPSLGCGDDLEFVPILESKLIDELLGQLDCQVIVPFENLQDDYHRPAPRAEIASACSTIRDIDYKFAPTRRVVASREGSGKAQTILSLEEPSPIIT
jgi:hypothetical protein